MNTGTNVRASVQRRIHWISCSCVGCCSIQEQLAHLLVHLRQSLDQRALRRRRLLLQLRRNASDLHLVAVRTLEHHRAVSHQVHHALVRVLQTDRNLYRRRVQLQLVAQLTDHAVRVRALTVQLVDERQTGNVVALHLTVHRDRLRLHA